MKERIARLEELARIHGDEISQLFRIESKQNGNYEKNMLEHQDYKNNFKELHEKLDSIIKTVEYTNGTVKLHTKILYIVGAVSGTLLLTNGSSLINFLAQIIK